MPPLHGYELIAFKVFKKFVNGSFHKYGQKSIVNTISKQKNIITFQIVFFKKFLLSIDSKIKKTRITKGTIIPRILTSIARAQAKDDKKAFL